MAAIVERLEALCGCESAAEDYVRFRIELLKAQAAVREGLARSAPPAQASDAAQEGKTHALGADDVPFDSALLAGLLKDLAAALRGRGHRGGDPARLSAAAAAEPALLEELARRAAFAPDEAFLNSLSGRLAMSPEALLFLGRVLAAPFVAEAVRRLKEGVGTALPESSGCCPYCGSPPGLCKLRREDGRRILFCSLCGESWEFARMACPFCGNGRALGVLSPGSDEGRWIETCEHCRGYLKTLDERKLPADETLVPLVEAVATLYLDLIAEKEGYAGGPPYSALR